MNDRIIPQKYYDTISDIHTDIFSCRDYNEFLKGDWCRIVKPMLVDITEALLNGVNRVEFAQVVIERDKASEDAGKRIFRNIETEEAKLRADGIDFNDLDIAALAKLISYCIFNCNDSSGWNCVTKISAAVAALRNDSSHTGAFSPQRNLQEMEKIAAGLEEIPKRVTNPSVPLLYRARKGLQEISEAYLPVFKMLVKDSRIYLNNMKPNPGWDRIWIKYLRAYIILIDETALLGNYGCRMMLKLMHYHGERLFVPHEAIYTIRQIAKNGNGIEAERAKDILKLLNDNKDDFRRLEAAEEEDIIEGFSEDAILGFLKKSGGIDVCLITENESLEASAEKLRRQDLIICSPGASDSLDRYAAPVKKERKADVQDVISFNVVPNATEDAVSTVSPDSSEKTKNVRSYPEDRPSQAAVPAVSGHPTENMPVSHTVPVPATDEFPHRVEGKRSVYVPTRGDTVKLDGYIKDKVSLADELSSGGEGTIYTVSDYGSVVVKIYKKNRLTPERVNKLKAMVNAYGRLEDNAYKTENICWPMALVFNPSGEDVVGYAMKKITGAETVQDYLNSEDKKDSKKKKTRRDIVKLCMTTAQQFRALHEMLNGTVLMGDINPKNILFDGERAYFIDVDSYQFEEYCCPVGMPDYLSPALIEKTDGRVSLSSVKRSREDERFAVAVLFFYVLFIKQYPFETNENTGLFDSVLRGRFSFANSTGKQARRSYIWQNLTEELRNAFTRIFKEKIYDYSDSDWNRMLLDMDNAIASDRLSRDWFPTCVLTDENDKFVGKKCRGCGEQFSVSEISDKEIPESYCPACRVKNAITRSRIFSVTCPECGMPFTACLFDLNDMDPEKFLCPDCGETQFSKYGEFFDGGSGSRRAAFDDRLLYHTKNALRNCRKEK